MSTSSASLASHNFTSSTGATVSPPSSINPESLTAMLGFAGAPVVLDVRRPARFAQSPRMIAGALYCPPEEVSAFGAGFLAAGQSVVVYCVYGHGVGRDAAAQLLSAGYDAQYLAGGFEGGQNVGDETDDASADLPGDTKHWRATPPLSFLKRPDLGVTGQTASRWITRERPKIDRIACPWLIRRFIDVRAEFFYVPSAQVLERARAMSAVAFDLPMAPITHEGDLCSFDALLKAFDLRDPALDLLARIVRGADTDRLDLSPQSAGLLAMSLGLSMLYAAHDHGMLEAAMPIYDALFAWCRSQVQGKVEAHNWRPESMVSSASAARPPTTQGQNR